MQEHIPVEEVFEQLRCTKEGLTMEEGEARLKVFGPNKLEEKSVGLMSTLNNSCRRCQWLTVPNNAVSNV